MPMLQSPLQEKSSAEDDSVLRANKPRKLGHAEAVPLAVTASTTISSDMPVPSPEYVAMMSV